MYIKCVEQKNFGYDEDSSLLRCDALWIHTNVSGEPVASTFRDGNKLLQNVCTHTPICIASYPERGIFITAVSTSYLAYTEGGLTSN
jgi:hypothetical protein